MVTDILFYFYFILLQSRPAQLCQPTKTLGPYVRMCSNGSYEDSNEYTYLLSMTTERSPLESEMTMDDVKNLIKRKDDIEEQIKAYYDVLEDVSPPCWY